jgi:hypothetical protein
MVPRKPPGPRLVAGVAIVITGVWGLVGLVGLFTGDYTALLAVTPIMALNAGYLFGMKGGTKT